MTACVLRKADGAGSQSLHGQRVLRRAVGEDASVLDWDDQATYLPKLCLAGNLGNCRIKIYGTGEDTRVEDC